VPCPACARGEWDFCRNGLYTERGIRRRHGFGAERWRVEPGFAVKVPAELGDLGVLVEPGSDVAKVWDQVEMVGSRSWYEPETVLITGAGPIGLLAALLGVQRGLDVVVLDRMDDGVKPALVRDLGARYVTSLDQVSGQVDIAIECTGVGTLAYGAARLLAPAGVLCLIGISHREAELTVPYEALNRELVMKNAAIVGSVNAARKHFVDAVEALRDADPEWLGRLITRRVPLSRWQDALNRTNDDVKVVVDLQG
jgi:threonine dehydrogenase-like Zn-dependent dehydrogenase